MPGNAHALTSLPRTVWILGFVSLLMDIASEMIHGLLPIFLTTNLGASMVLVGVITGAGEATAQIIKVFSGALSDRLGRRKPLLLLGYGLAAVTKPVFAVAGSLALITAAHMTDRVGKGIRGAPRDALIADVTPENQRGAAYGLRQSLDTVGAVIGPLLAIALLWLLANDIRAVFWFAVAPAALAVLLIVFWVDEPRMQPLRRPPNAMTMRSLHGLGRPFWIVTAMAALFGMARLGDAFLILRVQSSGLPIAWIPIVLVVMNIVYSAVSLPAGRASDRIGRTALLGASCTVLIGAYLVLAFATDVIMALTGVALFGAHMGLSQGVLAAMVADRAPENLRGTAFGVFNLVSGVAALAAGLLGGLIWDIAGPFATFMASAALALASAMLLASAHRQKRDSGA